MAKVLIVEDDAVIADGMAHHLTAAGFDPIRVENGTAGLARLRFERPDVCVVDLMLPGTDGWKLIENARSEGIGTPIIVVSPRGTEHDRVHALEIGADDYLVKPFSMKELVARVRAAARRGVSETEPRRGDPIEIEDLRIDPHPPRFDRVAVLDDPVVQEPVGLEVGGEARAAAGRERPGGRRCCWRCGSAMRSRTGSPPGCPPGLTPTR